MRVLDLFSGIGAFSLGLQRAGMTPIAFCEIDPYCRDVLARHWPGVPIFHDVRTAEFPAADIIIHPDPRGHAEPHGGAFPEVYHAEPEHES